MSTKRCMRAELRLICHRCGQFYRTPILSMLCPPCAGSQRQAVAS